MKGWFHALLSADSSVNTDCEHPWQQTINFRHALSLAMQFISVTAPGILREVLGHGLWHELECDFFPMQVPLLTAMLVGACLTPTDPVLAHVVVKGRLT